MILINNFGMMMRIQGDVSVDQVRTALNKVRFRHLGLFPGRPSDELSDELVFLLSVRTASAETDWIEAAQLDLREAFPDEIGPYARFILLQHPDGIDLVGTFHHRYSDGISGMFTMRDLAQALGQPDVALVPLPAPPAPNTLIPKALLSDAGVQRRLSWTVFKLRMRVLREKIRQRFSSPPSVETSPAQETAAGEIPLEEQFVILPTRLTVEQTSALMARCKKEQVSVHTAICIAWLRAFANEPTEPVHNGTISSPVNTRARLSSPVGDTTGPFLSIIKTHVDGVAERAFWEVAREFKQKFNNDLRDEILFSRQMIMSRTTKLPESERDMVRRMVWRGGVNYDFSVTNLGKLPIPEKIGPLHVESFYGPLVNSTPLERTVGVSTLGGRLGLSYIFRKSKMNPAIGQSLMNRAINTLLEATN